jgi:hypothetical protein
MLYIYTVKRRLSVLTGTESGSGSQITIKNKVKTNLLCV